MASAAVIALVAGLLVWSSWNQPPAAPTALRARSPIATSVHVTWSASKGGATIDHYLVLRNDRQVGSVPAGQTSYSDNGLSPGTRYRYTVIGESGAQRSAPSVATTVRTIAPAPVGVTETKRTWNTATFAWSPSPKGPAPTGYVIYRGGQVLRILPGTTGKYTITNLKPGTTTPYGVSSEWGTVESAQAGPVQVATLSPPLEGPVQVEVTTVSTPGGGASFKTGDRWSEAWNFTPDCVADKCTFKARMGLDPPDYQPKSFGMTMSRSGGGYAGRTTAQITECGSVQVRNNVILNVTGGQVTNGAWSSWTGTMVITSPYATANSTSYCPSQSWRFSVAGGA
ncbi:MAG: fibronectin type III domain-containing protein [Trebonia sp.]